ncbi:hypothetical protein PaeBR_20840 [Paenibacillus sp. BR2-3]|uniref:hypothetical protein n=1 Tax=Paenibacillus sp. BR2-3 TaxID=3048494 RepID=UPI003977C788
MLNWMIAVIYYSFITCWSLGFIYRFRSSITGTIAMISPMASGMIVGFGSGTLVGAMFESNLLLSLLISVLVGISAGGIIGSFISIGAFLNGALSGMMAGMMGAMLIGMLPSSQWNRVIFIFMAVGAVLQFIHTLMLQGQINEDDLKHSTWVFRTPTLVFLITAALIFLFSAGGSAQNHETVPRSTEKTQQSHNMINMQ